MQNHTEMSSGKTYLAYVRGNVSQPFWHLLVYICTTVVEGVTDTEPESFLRARINKVLIRTEQRFQSYDRTRQGNGEL